MKKETESEGTQCKTTAPVDWSSGRAKRGRRHTTNEFLPVRAIITILSVAAVVYGWWCLDARCGRIGLVSSTRIDVFDGGFGANRQK